MGNPDQPDDTKRDWAVTVEDGIAKSNEPVSSAVADPAAATRRHEPHEPPRETLPEKLYEARKSIHNKRIDGPFRRFKWFVMLVTLGIYYVTPWLRWDRGPYAPDQAVLVDLANRRFYMFGIEIWPHEFYFVAGLLIMAGIGLFVITSAVGRAWCGYACPQTVWTDLFQHIDRFVDGDRNARIRLENAPWTWGKVFRRGLKWSIYLAIGFLTGGAWILYFADAPTLFRDFFALEAAPVAYITVAVLTLTTVTLGGFMREQVCIYMCPWPRIQGAMMDDDTLTVAYRDWRGEPRGKGNMKKRARIEAEAAEAAAQAAGPGHARYGPTPYPGRPVAAAATATPPAIATDGVGDCIDCMACVNVCPMGIDIRNGQQMECITCALCIDACDDVMEKIGRPRGLIDYLALSDEGRERTGQPPRPIWHHVLRTRTLIYTALWGLIGLGLLWALFVRADIDMTVAPIRNPQFVTLSDGSIRNAYDVRLRNKHGDERPFRVTVTGDPALRIDLEGTPYESVAVPANETRLQRVYVIAPPSSGPATTDATDIRFWVEDLISAERAHVDSLFNGKDVPQ